MPHKGKQHSRAPFTVQQAWEFLAPYSQKLQPREAFSKSVFMSVVPKPFQQQTFTEDFQPPEC